jgi:hypothetical protein
MEMDYCANESCERPIDNRDESYDCKRCGIIFCNRCDDMGTSIDPQFEEDENSNRWYCYHCLHKMKPSKWKIHRTATQQDIIDMLLVMINKNKSSKLKMHESDIRDIILKRKLEYAVSSSDEDNYSDTGCVSISDNNSDSDSDSDSDKDIDNDNKSDSETV